MTTIKEPLWIIGLSLLAVLLAALVLSKLAQVLLGSRADLRSSTGIVVAIIGSAVGLLIVGAGTSATRLVSPIPILACLIGSIAAIGLYSALAARLQRPVPTSIPDLLAAGESDRVEFKSTARVNLKTGEKDPRMELVIVKTLAAFLNSDGGTLIIGADDAGNPLGLDADYQTLRTSDADRYELWMNDLVAAGLGQNAAASADIAIESLPTADGPREVCRISVTASPRPVYLAPSKNAPREFWVRIGNSTRQLAVDQAAEYIMHRWPMNVGPNLAAQLRATVRFT
ncbi:ATP-binding protein [Gordonia alkaliphila]|uniref:Schlafen AlbA-2 domain-containing protein n=1 Tax=Gordonia alkaliphila TaxID=1053547 RepID=A0ABP8ZEH0_9ACTN|nr:ATP-binding protein [Gordonia alkaliphila]MCK0437915.1 ATP-binding protein [Gordonia alkaliphila]